MTVLLLVLACSGQPVDTSGAGDTGPAVDDTGTLGWEAVPPAAEYAVDELDGLIAAMLDERLVHPVTLSAWFVETASVLMGTSTKECPQSWLTGDDGQRAWTYSEWSGSCSTGGVSLDGGWIATYETVNDGDVVTASTNVLMSFTGGRADGSLLAGGGALRSEAKYDTVGNLFFAYDAEGAFRDTAVNGGLADGISVGLAWAGMFEGNGALTGTFTGPLSAGDDAIELTSIEVDPLCGTGASGQLRVRDPSAGWWTVDYADDCSGCGPISWLGEEVGESCAGDEVAQVLAASFSEVLVAR